MNKKWDYDVPSVEFWKEVYRVLKPGGHVLSFGGTRTYHRMVVNMEDAGFEIRDQIMWIYGSGFPKSHNIGKGVDKKFGNEREVVGEKIGKINLNDIKEGDKSFYENAWLSKNYINIDITKGQSEWEGWGTALKPANEPICLARKPLSEKTIVDNVIKWGTGGINIDGCRIGTDGGTKKVDIDKDSNTLFDGGRHNSGKIEELGEGRFPANILFDEEAAQILDEQSGITKTTADKNYKYSNTDCSDSSNTFKGRGKYTPREDKGGASRFFYIAKVSKKERNLGLEPVEVFHQRPRREDGSVIYKEKNYDEWLEAINKLPRRDKTSKAAAEEKLQTQSTSLKNTHPTLKPINLMTYLCRMITPPGGIVLDPFMGSGSTGISACLEGFRFVGMELDEDYFKIAEARVNNFEEYRKLLK
jgi:site-specific DNA-methyltransferase (adenine-specific)